MKCKVHFEFPFRFKDEELPSEEVVVDLPSLPRAGDSLNTVDPQFRILHEKVVNFFSRNTLLSWGCSFNVVNRVSWNDGEPTVIVGYAPAECVLVLFYETEKPLVICSPFIPSVGDYIADGRFCVHKRLFKGSNLVLLDVILDDEEEDPRVLSGHEVNL